MGEKSSEIGALDNIRRKKKTLDFMRRFIVLAGIAIVISVYAILGLETFFSLNNFLIIIQQTASLAIVGFGITFVIMQGGIDLSVGSVVAVSGLAAGYVLNSTNI